MNNKSIHLTIVSTADFISRTGAAERCGVFPIASQSNNRRAADAIDLPVREPLVGIARDALQIGRN